MSEDQNNVGSSEPPMSPHKEYQEINAYVVCWDYFMLRSLL
ncbi:hypothetical protein [Sporomusa acidovorans]|uniref:Uncharacterized protein n=1 Tax=Sporomusa acidovorans (strain ATCC 49682 / DSM 3132 / Mol) TaxID=1123286 RepID=A0ABZ3J665_SPOA4|nr:hypothetical protein [Sporomusa acidovorans]OZC21030.1 hypothetical protein SPACI_21720 [Sporomusa acidovorans DSM 3132]SDF17922.1 hypothetical protein SAMN04488499_103633 [Sporomusa acidovorans]